jgi:ribosomal protein L11 methyltransferase
VSEDRVVCVEASNSQLAERVLAEVSDVGAAGMVEERIESSIVLTIYLDAVLEQEMSRALDRFKPEGLFVGRFQDVVLEDWSESWKQGHVPVEISTRLLIRPPFSVCRAERGQAEVVINPGQAFGTGRHESTRLALESLDELAIEEPGLASLLDVGTGSGVLALAALRLGMDAATGFDLDKTAVSEAARQAVSNQLSSRLLLFAGPIQALASSAFDVVIVNMLRSEMIAIASEIAACVGSHLVLSGLLDADVEIMLKRFSEEGLTSYSSREAVDESGNVWRALRLSR